MKAANAKNTNAATPTLTVGETMMRFSATTITSGAISATKNRAWCAEK